MATKKLKTLKSLDLSVIFYSIKDDPCPPLGGVRMKAEMGLRKRSFRNQADMSRYLEAAGYDTGTDSSDITIYKIEE